MKKSLLFPLFVVALGLNASAFAQSLYKNNVEASYYADKYNGNLTASGETFNMYDFTAAHKTLPFNTLVKVTNLENGKSVTVRINDRGPSVPTREIDVSKAAAIELGMIGTGTARVSLEIIQTPSTTVSETPVAPATQTTQNEAVAWDIQVGAYSNRANADTLVSRLVESGFTNIAYQEAGQVTRVLIYDVDDNNVQAVTSQLNAFGFNNYVVRKHQEPASTGNGYNSGNAATGTVRTTTGTAAAPATNGNTTSINVTNNGVTGNVTTGSNSASFSVAGTSGSSIIYTDR